LVVGYISPTVPVPETVRLLEIARATLPPEKMATAAPAIIAYAKDPVVASKLATLRTTLPPERYSVVGSQIATALSAGKTAEASAIITVNTPKPMIYVTPKKKTQAQIYEENWQRGLTLKEWATLWSIPVEQAPFKLGEEGRKYAEKYPPTVTVTPAPTPPAEAPSWLPILALLGAAYFLTRRK